LINSNIDIANGKVDVNSRGSKRMKKWKVNHQLSDQVKSQNCHYMFSNKVLYWNALCRNLTWRWLKI